MPLLYGIIFGIIAFIGYGVSDFMGPLTSRKMGAIQTNLMLRAITSLFMLVIFLVLLIQIPEISLSTFLLLLVTGVFSVIGPITYYKSAKLGNISINSAVANSWSIVTVILILIFLRVPLTLIEAISIAVIILGTLLLSIKLEDIRKMKFTNLSEGTPYAFVAMLAWGIAYFLMILLIGKLGWFQAALLVSFLMVGYYIAVFGASKIKYVKPRPFLLTLLINAIFLTLAVLAYNVGVLSNPIIVPPIAAASPVITVLLAVTRLKEKLEINHIAGIAMVVIGLIALSI
ncbi:MAG: DMT family transporter [Candidatus Micrarchaeota archaeon]|nr:DMT family transporter [Candidatus Micrarchaeota archaeon]